MSKSNRLFYLLFLSFTLIFCLEISQASAKTIYLTFDDGPVGGTENVLDALDETKVTATFFLVGEHIETTGRKRLLPRIRNYGAGNHSYSHWAKESDFTRRTPQDYLEDFRNTDPLILGQPGKVVPCRLPGNQPTQKKPFVRALMEDGRNVIGWDVEISSSLTKTPDKAVAKILSAKKDTVIVLFHDAYFNRRRGKEDLVRIINSLKARGHKLETFGSAEAPSEERRAMVKLGIDVLIENNIDLLKGKRIGLITNQTGTNSKLEQTIDLLHKHPEVNLVALFSPEHGLRGMVKAGRQIQSSHDEYTGLPIHSLYGKTRRPTPGMLRGLDVLIFDIQDIGARSYTYISTMAYAMEEAGKNGIEFIVLDRPNPLGGLKIEGPFLDPNLKSFIGLYPIPTVHGMTVGELANLYKGEENLPVKLRVIRMEGWDRSMVWGDTGLTWIPTSPWIPTVEAAMLYPGIGLLGETGLVSIGIGYTLPFQIAGAPWISSHKLAEKMREKHLPGVVFRPFYFEPFPGKFKFSRERCEGIHIHVVDSHKYMPITTGMYIISAIRELYPEKFNSLFNETRRKSFDRHLGRSISSALREGEKVEIILESWQKEIEKFRQERKQYLLYD